jgi:hypothetical protein
VQLLAIAGGFGPGTEDVLDCCLVFPLLPLVSLLACLAVYRNAAWPAVAALLITGLPYLTLCSQVASYQPSDDWEIQDLQATGRRLVGSYLWPVGIAGASALFVGCGRLVSWCRSRRTRRRN